MRSLFAGAIASVLLAAPAAAQETPSPRADDPSETTALAVGAGGLFSSGNARQIALTSLGRFRMRREEDQVSGAATVNYARAGRVGEEIKPTVENYEGLARYDRFFNNHISAFGQARVRRDLFEDLELRLNLDPGLAYYFINTKTHRLQGEVGYDLQFDVRRVTPPLAKDHTLHNARLSLGYENELRKEVSLVTSFEYLPNFADLGVYRFVFDIGLKSQVSDSFAIATTYTARYENRPLPNVVSLDSIASVNLVYSFY